MFRTSPASGRRAATRLRRTPVVFLSALLIAGLAAASARGADAAPREPRRTVHLAEEWRLGGDDAGVMFGLMIEAVSDEAGNVYLLDQQLCQVTVVAPDGRVLRVIGREGEGPGEVRTPQDLALLPDGTVGLVEQFPGRLVKLTRTGLPAGSVRFGRGADGGFTMAAGFERQGDVLLLGALFQVPIEHGQSRVSYLAAVDSSGNERVRYCEHVTRLDFQQAHFSEKAMLAAFLGAHALDDAGRVYAARDWNAYAIDVHAPDGTLLRTIERPFTPLPRTDRERARVDALFEVQARQLPFPITWDVEPNARTVEELRVDESGDLWVRHARSGHAQPSGVLLTYDVFSPEGAWLREVSVACPGDPAYDGLIFLGDGRVLLVKGLVMARLTASGSQGAVYDEEDQARAEALEVICCRLAP